MPRDDDDDRPRKRRPRDDEDDDRPRSRRKPRDDDEDDDRPRSRRRERDEDDYDDRPRKKKKKKKPPQQSVLGGVALSTGILGLVMSFVCGAIGLAPAAIGLVLGIIALVIAQKSEGRQSPILPLAGSAVSLVATGISIFFLVSFIRQVKEIRDDFKQDIEQYEKEEAQRKKEIAKAAGEVQAGAESAIRVTAVQFYQAYDNDDEQADRVYKNKIIEVTGVLDEVNFKGEVYMVLLKGGRDQDETVDCNFAKSPEVRARLAQ